jgi:RNA polymerase sigma factor (sigma-70 family)
MRITDDLVSAAQVGDAAALRALYRDLAPMVLGYLTAKGVPDPEAVTSDVFVDVIKRLAVITGGASGVRKFVMTVAHARMVDDVRRRRCQPAMTAYTPEADVRVSASAEHDALCEIGTARVVRLLRRLPAAQREVLLLRVLADLSIDEVAEIVAKSPGAVKQLQRRGLLTLRELLCEARVTL